MSYEFIIPFTDVETTSIPYPALFARMPIITIGYKVGDDLVQSGIYTEARITPNSIEIDHGGSESGVIRVTP